MKKQYEDDFNERRVRPFRPRRKHSKGNGQPLDISKLVRSLKGKTIREGKQ